jgi:signal transduction histidine kinase
MASDAESLDGEPTNRALLAGIDVGSDAFFAQTQKLLVAEPSQALAVAAAALQEAIRRSDPLAQVRALLLKGMASDALGSAERDSLLAEALCIAERAGDPLTLVRAVNGQMVVEIYHGRYADALWRGQAVLGMAHALQRRDLLWRLTNNLGTALSLIGEFELALSMFTECLGWIEDPQAQGRQSKLRTVNNMAMALLGMARNSRMEGDTAGAESALARARPLAESACEGALGEPHGALRAGSLDTLVAVLLEQGEVEEALRWVSHVGRSSAALLPRGSVSWGTHALAQCRAELASPMGDVRATYQRLKEIEGLPGPRFKSGEMHALLNQCLSQALARLERWAESLTYHRRWLQFETRTQSLLAREHAMAVHRTLDSLRNETEEFITHDLRNPLGAALLQLSTAAGDAVDDALKRDISDARSSVQRVFDMADHYLALVRMRHLRRADLGEFDLAELVDDVGERLAPPSGADVRLFRDVAWGMIVRGDRISLLAALTELLRSALARAPSGSEVKWLLGQEDREAVLVLSDVGEALAPNVMQRLRRPCSAVKGGPGLGYAVVARAAQVHGAPIEVTSTSGSGTQIFWRFPRVDGESER